MMKLKEREERSRERKGEESGDVGEWCDEEPGDKPSHRPAPHIDGDHAKPRTYD